MPYYVQWQDARPWWSQTATTSAATAGALYYRYSQQQQASTWTSATSSAGLWQEQTAMIYYATLLRQQPDVPVPPWHVLAREASPEEAAREAAAMQLATERSTQRRQAAAIAASVRRQAEERARELLLANLSEEQRHTFERNSWFVVEGGRSGQRYRIRYTNNMVANVDLLDIVTGGVMHRLCAHCRHGVVPIHDQLLAQKMMLECAEDDFLRIANRHGAA